MQKKVIHLSVVEDFEKQFEKAISLQERAEIAVVDYNALASKTAWPSIVLTCAKSTFTSSLVSWPMIISYTRFKISFALLIFK